MSPQKHRRHRTHRWSRAADENRKEPEKSKPHGELPHEDAGSGNAGTRVQNKPWDQAKEFQADDFAGRKDAGGDHQVKKPAPKRSKS